MVLREEWPPSEAGNKNKNSSSLTKPTIKTMSTNEQPVNKRQRIQNSNENDEPESDENSKISSSSSSSSTSINQYQDGGHDELDRSSSSTTVHHLSSLGENAHSLPNLLNYPDLVKLSQTTSFVLRPVVNANNDNDIGVFQSYLKNQCLCSASERVLRKPFQSHYINDTNGPKRIAPLTEWPQTKLLQFLSNLQLLFEIYLKQNQKGHICARIMDVCDALIRNEHNLIDEIIDLCDYNNRFVTFLAGRVLSSFLVISKDTMDSNWLKKIVNNLFMFETLDYVAVRKISFSLDIIKRIVEWKDVVIHPLDANADDDGNHECESAPLPPIETNYFSQYYTQSNPGTSSSNNSNSNSNTNSNSSNSSNNRNLNSHQSSSRNPPSSSSHSDQITTDCQIIALTDSESFDTTNLKCVTIQILENKWPALVKNMSSLIISHYDINMAENCIITFLTLWESIISVRTNLSVIETLPFYAQLDKFALLLNQTISCTIYKQILTLFNEALCYGSTLALQDLLPEETCNLAHQIVRHVKDYRILDSLPRRQPENSVGLIEYIGRPVQYLNGTFDLIQSETHTYDSVDMDRTLLQKIVLLVLKSVAVTVKEIRSDSSDSSIDSTDYDAFEDLRQIVRSIRDVLKKLENFIKNTLEFHPESHFSKLLIHLFNDQDDYLIEAMVCTLDVTAGISFRNNAFPELVSMLNPVYTFLEFLKMVSNSADLLLDLLVNNETCFLLYLLRFLKYIRLNWSMFVQSCRDCGIGNNILDDSMGVLIRLRLKISRLVSKSLYPYDISPILRLLECCESLYEGNELS